MRNYPSCRKHFDVQIMLAQMILLFNLESEVEKWRNTKLERLRDRLSEVMA